MISKIVLSLLWCILSCQLVFAGNFAYLIDEEKLHKLDIPGNKIISSVPMPVSPAFGYADKVVYVDPKNRTLFILYGGPNISINAYDLDTLALKKNLPILSSFQDGDFPLVIIPPTGSRFYVKWIQGEETEITTVFDKTSIERIGDITRFPSAYEFLGYSQDGTKIVTVDINTPAKVKLVDSVTFNLIEEIAIDNIFVNPTASRGVTDFDGNLILIAEDSNPDSTAPDNKDILYSYDIQNGKSTTKILTGINGVQSRLSPDGAVVLVNEAKYVLEGNHFILTRLGIIHVFETQTGKKRGIINIIDDNYCNLLGISPDSVNAYFVSKIPTKNENKVSVVDLTKLSVVAEIPGMDVFEMVFEEK